MRSDLRPDRRLLVVGAVVVVLSGALGVLLGSLGVGASGATPTPAAVTSTPSSGPSPSPAADPELVALLPPEVYRDCVPRETAAGQITSVRCLAATDGADELLVTQWRDREAMEEGSGFRRLPDGKCSRETEVRSTWDGGALACYANDNGHAVVLWQYDDRALQVVAVRTDGTSRALYAWWLEAARVPLR